MNVGQSLATSFLHLTDTDKYLSQIIVLFELIGYYTTKLENTLRHQPKIYIQLQYYRAVATWHFIWQWNIIIKDFIIFASLIVSQFFTVKKHKLVLMNPEAGLHKTRCCIT